MINPDTIITTMSQQREQERAQDLAYYMLRKACEARAVELYEALRATKGRKPRLDDKLLKDIDDASH